MSNYLLLTANGLHNSAQLNIENDFTFIVGDHQYPCSKILASFISPKVSKLLLTDYTISEFNIDHSDQNKEFQQIISLMTGYALSLRNADKDYLLKMAIQLGNEEIINVLIDDSEKINNDNAIQKIILKYSNNFQFINEAKYIAVHFDEFSIESLQNLDVEILDSILNQDSLFIFNEDSLFEKIIRLGEKYYSLLNYIQFEYLSCNAISQFLSYIDINNISSQLWSSIKKRLQLPVHPSLNPTRYSNSFVLDKEYPFDGLFALLMSKHGGNIHEKGIVNITSSSDPEKNVKFISDSDWESYWFSDDVPDSWVQFDFKDNFIIVTDYTLQSDGSKGNHLLHWQLEGSNDGKSWEIIDKRDTNDLNGLYCTSSYSCFLKKPFRMIRIKQTGKNSSNQDYMLLAGVEFFGQLMNSK